MTYPDGEVVTTTYNSQDLPETLTGTSAYITKAGYKASDQLSSLTFSSAITTTYGYDSNTLRLTSLQTTGNIQDYDYTYDNTGNVKTITNNFTSKIERFTYDELNRLKTGTITGVYSQTWTY